MPGRIRGLHHIVLSVTDPERNARPTPFAHSRPSHPSWLHYEE
ncbi:MAG TPA: hypothetical protein VJ123_04595 [Anaerolineales bacterium]|nr:hypothetical protein [Anaerolineales bacterium]